MPIFGSKKNKVEKKVTTKTEKAVAVVAPIEQPIRASVSDLIIRPRITEKSGLLSQTGVYTFEVAKFANKNSIAKAVTALYKVVPVKVAVINLPGKNVFVRGKRGFVTGTRKALVTLKKGDKIDFV